MTNLPLHRPEPRLHHTAQSVDRTLPPRQAATRLYEGEALIITDRYRTGASILGQLRALMPPPDDDASYEVRRAFRRTWQETSQRLLAPIADNRLALSQSPSIGFLKQLYPDHGTFALPFTDVQNLNSAWNRYKEGIHLAVLGYRVHPFYGTYVPTRVSHLELFATWLSQYEGPRARAIDVGTGCGVLALLLCKAGFEGVLATDTNPNAIESVGREIRRFSCAPPIDLHCSDLLGDATTPADLIVFNPPWMQGTVEGPLDAALYFEEGLFERFFAAASAQLTPSGRVVVVFSNLIQLVQPDIPHPIQAELERGRFKEVQKLHRKVKNTRTHGRTRSTRERVEIWELARA